MSYFRLLPVISALASLVTANSPAEAAPAPPPPRFITLDAPYAHGSTMPRRINDTGRIVGTYLNLAHKARGFRLAHGVYTPIPLPIPKGGMLETISVNGSGQTVGTYHDAQNHPHTFLWRHGKSTVIAPPDAMDVSTRVFDINDEGDIVGTFGDGGGAQNFIAHGFLIRHGTYTTIDFPNADIVNVFGINDSGQMVGTFARGRSSHAFLLSHGVRTVIDVPGADYTFPFGINNKGQVVGLSIFKHSHHDSGFLWSHGTFTQIGFPTAPDHTTAFGINDQGQIVGFYSDHQGHIHGFLRTP